MTKKINIFYNKYKILFVFLAGCLASLGFAPYHFFIITIIAFYYCLLILESSRDKKQAFVFGLIFGLGHQASSLYWISISFDVANHGGYIIGFIAVLALSFFLSLITAISFFIIKSFSTKLNNTSNAILIIILLSMADWLKGNILWEFPWTPISTIWAFSKLTISPFSILGVWGYSLVTFSLIVGVFIFKYNRKSSFFMIAPFVLILFLGSLPNKDNENNFSTISLRLVQPNIKQIDKWDIRKLDANIENLISLSNKKRVQKFDLVIWPETSVPFDVEKNNKKFRESLSKINSLMVGAIRKQKIIGEYKIFNSLFLIKNNFNSMQYYDKIKLVPFGEFIPFRKFINYRNFTLGGTDFSSGKNLKILDLNNNVKVLPLICYEVIFPKITRANNKKYNLIINITNDGWYGKSSGPYQHLALAKIRAVQEGTVLVRVANTGISAIINYNGTIIDKIDLGKRAVLDKELVLTKKNTMYSKFGDSIFFSLIIVLCFLLIILNFNFKRVNKHE